MKDYFFLGWDNFLLVEPRIIPLCRWSLVITSHSLHSQEQNFSVQQLMGGEGGGWAVLGLGAVCCDPTTTTSCSKFQLCFFYQSPPNLLRPLDTSKNWTPLLILGENTGQPSASVNWLKSLSLMDRLSLALTSSHTVFVTSHKPGLVSKPNLISR